MDTNQARVKAAPVVVIDWSEDVTVIDHVAQLPMAEMVAAAAREELTARGWAALLAVEVAQ